MTTSATSSRSSRTWASSTTPSIVFTTDNGAENITFPDGGTTPFKGGKLTTWEGGMRAPLVVRWPGHIKPGTVKNEMMSALDWLPTLVDIAGGPKGDALKKQIEAGSYPGIVKTTLDGVDQRAYLEGTSRNRRATCSSTTPARNRRRCATRTGSSTTRWCRTPGPAGCSEPRSFHWTQVANIKRDPFEQTVGSDAKSLLGYAGSIGSPSTAYLYDWNILPIGQLLWEKELMSYKEFPPMQAPETYNLDGILAEMKKSGHQSE